MDEIPCYDALGMGWLERVGEQIGEARKKITADRTEFSKDHGVSEHIIKRVEAGQSVNTRYLDAFAAAVHLRIEATCVPITATTQLTDELSSSYTEDEIAMLHDTWIRGFVQHLTQVEAHRRGDAVVALTAELNRFIKGESAAGRQVQRGSP